jgi:hypothetical protein
MDIAKEKEHLIGWLRRRVELEDYEVDYVNFIMGQYAELYAQQKVENIIALGDVVQPLTCVKCGSDYLKEITGTTRQCGNCGTLHAGC